jgi:MoxR-like ATPase
LPDASTGGEARAAEDLASLLRALEMLDGVILGKPRQLRLCIACLLAGGHLLIEDIPASARRRSRTASRARSACPTSASSSPATCCRPTSSASRSMSATRAPSAFTPARCSPSWCWPTRSTAPRRRRRARCSRPWKSARSRWTASAIRCPEPFFVVATQNPEDQVGTFPLPESQLDRFLMRIRLGYPERALERELLRGEDRRELLARLPPAAEPGALLRLRREVSRVHASEALLDYVQALVAWSRERPGFGAGLSPRAAISLLRSARAWALLDGRKAVIPEDIQAVTPAVAGHRLRADGESAGADAGERLVAAVPIP